MDALIRRGATAKAGRSSGQVELHYLDGSVRFLSVSGESRMLVPLDSGTGTGQANDGGDLGGCGATFVAESLRRVWLAGLQSQADDRIKRV